MDSGGIRDTLVRLWRLQACQRPSENCKRGRCCSSTIDASPQTSTAPCVLALAILWTWPLSEHLSTRIPSDRERSNSEHLAALCATRERSHSVDRWWNPRGFFSMRGVLGLSEHPTGIGILDHAAGSGRMTARSRLTTSHASYRLRYRPPSQSCALASSSQFPAMSTCHGLGEWGPVTVYW